MPQCPEEINRYFVGLVATEYCEVGEEKGKARRVSSESDSTAASDVQGSLEDIQEGMKRILVVRPPNSEVDGY